MVRNRHSKQKLAAWLRTYWIGLVMVTFILLALAAGRAAAAPRAQSGTVPPPTPRPTSTDIPEATSTPRDGNDSNDDESNAEEDAPTDTPSAQTTTGGQAGQQSATQEGATGVINTARLNVRSGPGTNFGVGGVAVNGETVAIFERNADNSWWHICCATTTGAEGWVSAPFVRLNVEPAQVETAIPLAGDATRTAPTPTPRSATAATPAATSALTRTATPTTTGATTTTTTPLTTTAAVTGTQSAGDAPALALAIDQNPPFAWQGQELILTFTITNNGEETATNVELRNELPVELHFVEGQASSDATLAEEDLTKGRLAFIVTWPSVAPGESQTATVRIQIQADLPDGSVIDNLAVVSAEGVKPYTNGITIGMPPASPPTFQ
jgi:uncharacterized repeat protein (TIGR01451 family)